MHCLHCGWCCEKMSPLTNPEPCPHIEEIDGYKFCGNYERRPRECVDHSMPGRFCPIGVSVLNLDSEAKCKERIEIGNYVVRRKCTAVHARDLWLQSEFGIKPTEDCRK